jgi:hypothetical protein
MHACMRACFALSPRSVLCRALGNIPGVPKVHYKGRQGDFYIMVGGCGECLGALVGVQGRAPACCCLHWDGGAVLPCQHPPLSALP